MAHDLLLSSQLYLTSPWISSSATNANFSIQNRRVTPWSAAQPICHHDVPGCAHSAFSLSLKSVPRCATGSKISMLSSTTGGADNDVSDGFFRDLGLVAVALHRSGECRTDGLLLVSPPTSAAVFLSGGGRWMPTALVRLLHKALCSLILEGEYMQSRRVAAYWSVTRFIQPVLVCAPHVVPVAPDSQS